MIFQAGKNGTGYLIDAATMGEGAPAVYSAQVCKGSGSFGGDSFAGGVIYIPCTNGTMALAYDAAARTFTPLWQGPSDAFGPPIVSAGLVWTVATGGFNGGGTKLYGLDPASGEPRYTLTLPSPVTDHFGSPSAAGGRLFLATGSTLTAYQTAVLTPLEAPLAAGSRPGLGPDERACPRRGARPAREEPACRRARGRRDCVCAARPAAPAAARSRSAPCSPAACTVTAARSGS